MLKTSYFHYCKWKDNFQDGLIHCNRENEVEGWHADWLLSWSTLFKLQDSSSIRIVTCTCKSHCIAWTCAWGGSILQWAFVCFYLLPQVFSLELENVIQLCMYRLDRPLSQCSRSYTYSVPLLLYHTVAQPYWLLNPACAFTHRLSKLCVMDIVKYNQRNLSRDTMYMYASSLHLWFSKGYGHERMTSREWDPEPKTSQVEQGWTLAAPARNIWKVCCTQNHKSGTQDANVAKFHTMTCTVTCTTLTV